MSSEISPKELGIRLQDARKARNLTQQQVADHFGIARTTVTAIEKGERQVQPHELIQFAELYGRSVAELTRRGLPLASFTVQFRALLQSDRPDPALETAVDTFRRHCDDFLYLEQLVGSRSVVPVMPPYDAKGLPPDRVGELAAKGERTRLGLGDGPVVSLRSVLEKEVGLKVFFLDLPSHISGMFAFTDSHGGCVAINRNLPPERNNWSMTHEYGHYVTSRFHADIVGTADGTPSASPYERMADSFARHFLLPAETVNRRFDMLYQEHNGQMTPADLVYLADYFGVSFKAMVLRLEDLKRLPSGIWAELNRRGFKVQEARALLGVQTNQPRPDRFPRRYRLLAVRAFADAMITEGQLANLLHVDRLEARELVNGMLEEAGVDDLSLLGMRLSEVTK